MYMNDIQERYIDVSYMSSFVPSELNVEGVPFHFCITDQMLTSFAVSTPKFSYEIAHWLRLHNCPIAYEYNTMSSKIYFHDSQEFLAFFKEFPWLLR